MTGMPDKDFGQMLLDEIRLLRTEMTAMRSEVNAEISDLKMHMAALQASEAKQEKDTLAFWSERWGPLKSDISDIKNRLSSLEQKDVKALERRIDELEKENAATAERLKSSDAAELDKRLQKLEKGEMKKQGIAAGIGLASGGGVAALIEYLMGGG